MTQDPFAGRPAAANQQQADFDVLATTESVPAITFADANGNDCPAGAVVTLDVRETGQPVQERDFDTKELKFWTNKDGSQGNARMAAVFSGRVVRDDVGRNTVGEKRSLWASIPSNLLEALQKAQKEAGKQIGAGNGGLLHVRYDGRGEHRSAARAHLPKPKTYTVIYQPHAGADPMAQPAQQQAAPPPAQQSAGPSPWEAAAQSAQPVAQSAPQQSAQPVAQPVQQQAAPAQAAPPAGADPFAAPPSQGEPPY